MGIRFERIKEVLKHEYYEEFEKFMRGQTVGFIEVFDDYFLRWMKEKPIVD